MDDLAQGSHHRVRGRQGLIQPGLDRDRGIVEKPSRLADDELAAGIVIDDEIGEGAADVDTGTKIRRVEESYGRAVEEELGSSRGPSPVFPDVTLSATLLLALWKTGAAL